MAMQWKVSDELHYSAEAIDSRLYSLVCGGCKIFDSGLKISCRLLSVAFEY